MSGTSTVSGSVDGPLRSSDSPGKHASPSVSRTTYFRQATCFALLSLIVSFTTIVSTYLLVDWVMNSHVREMIINESRAIEYSVPTEDSQEARQQILRLLKAHQQMVPGRGHETAFQSADGKLMYGNAQMFSVLGCAGQTDPCEGWYASRRQTEHGTQRWLGYITRLSDGGRFLVAYDEQPMRARLRFIPLIAGLGIFVLLSFSLGVGLFLGAKSIRRVERFRYFMQRFAYGEADSRVPCSDRFDEFDRLGDHINAAFTRINLLMEEVRNATHHVAHELRTPLTRLHHRLISAQEATANNPQAQRELDIACQEVMALGAIFKDVMRISEIESGRCGRNFLPFDLAGMVRDLCELYEAPAAELEMRLAQDVLLTQAVTGDEALIFQALSNLVDNAIKYGPRGGIITISAYEANHTLVLTVADEGPGIAPQARNLALQRFQRLGKGSTVEGYGLGLAFVQAIASLHHGSITLEDNGVGVSRGLRVVLRLPLASA